MTKKPNFNKYPAIEIKEATCYVGWSEINNQIQKKLKSVSAKRKILAVDVYPGAYEEEISASLQKYIKPDLLIKSEDYFKDESEIRKMTERDLGDDPVFGVLSYLQIDDYFRPSAREEFNRDLSTKNEGIIAVVGTGASQLTDPDILVYVDMARWEIQQRQRQNKISNLGVNNKSDRPSLKYKWAFFIDWRICDRLKRKLFDRWDYVIDTNDENTPKMVSGDTMRRALLTATMQPFELKPFFDPGPWGGQWMKQVCGLDPETENYAWCFNCVPEENSLLFKFDDILFEIPSINLVFFSSKRIIRRRSICQIWSGISNSIRFS